jgi:hypothetical protein
VAGRRRCRARRSDAPKWGSQLDLGDVAKVDLAVFVADVKAAGQRYSHRIFAKFILPACALNSSSLRHDM